MTEHKFTDGEIIRDLLRCANKDVSFCKECRHRNYSDGCCIQLMKDALDLISRQRAEIEELEAEIDKQYEQAKADILGNMSDGGTSCHWCIDGHRTAAIKEFAERLKAELTTGAGTMRISVLAIIDNLVKEMTEEKTKT